MLEMRHASWAVTILSWLMIQACSSLPRNPSGGRASDNMAVSDAGPRGSKSDGSSQIMLDSNEPDSNEMIDDGMTVGSLYCMHEGDFTYCYFDERSCTAAAPKGVTCHERTDAYCFLAAGDVHNRDNLICLSNVNECDLIKSGFPRRISDCHRVLNGDNLGAIKPRGTGGE